MSKSMFSFKQTGNSSELRGIREERGGVSLLIKIAETLDTKSRDT